MEFLTEKKDQLKSKVNKLFQSYGHLCATNPLPMITSSVVIVLICSLPLLSHPVFERTATFLFGRIQLEKYKTNISVSSTKFRDKSSIIVQQVNLHLNVTVLASEHNKDFGKWSIFQKTLEIAGVRNISSFCKTSKSFNWTSSCLRVSRKPFYKSPQTRLIYPRGRFYKELRMLFSKSGCLYVSPVALCSTEERQFNDFPEHFKELLLGYPVQEAGLSINELQDETQQFRFTLSFFMRKYDERFSTALKHYFSSKENATVSSDISQTYRVRYMPTEDDDHMELILLSVTYVLVFFYILFSVGKINTLKSRWGLAFSAVMTIIMSMIMALGLCASLDLLPTTLTITEIFPYVVIVIGLENVMIITKSVMSTAGDLDVSAKVGKGMGKEGWYITKNLVAELTILAAGYHTLIPSLQEFCTFAYVGVLSDFFIQLVFFAPVLAVDIRRAELCHLEQITIGQQFAVGFNLMQKTALTLVPPSPPESLRSKYLKRMRKRIAQKVLMIVFVFYIIYAVYNKVQDEKLDTVPSTQSTENLVEAAKSNGFASTAPTKNLLDKSMQTKYSSLMNQNIIKSTKNWLSSNESGNDEVAVNGGIVSWEFLSKQHWPELLTFYHIPFNERSLLVLPTIDVSMNIKLNQPDLDSAFTFTRTSKMEDFLLVASLVVCSLCSLAVIWLLFLCLSKRRRRLTVLSNAGLFQMTKVLYRGHKHCIESMHADKPYIISVSIAGIVKVWDAGTAQCIMEVAPNKRKSADKDCSIHTTLRQRRYSRANRRFSTVGDFNPTCSVWCLDCKHNILTVAFSNGTIEVHVISSSKMIATLLEEEAVVDVKIVSRNTIIIGRIDGILDIIEIRRSQLDSVEITDTEDSWQTNIENGGKPVGCRIKHRIRAHIGPIENLVACSGVAFCCSADVIKVYEIDDAHCCNSLSLSGRQITTVHRIREMNGLIMAVGCEDGCIMIINSTGGKAVEYNWHKSYIKSICSNSKALASLDGSRKISIWSADGEIQSSITQGVPFDVYTLNFLNSAILCALSQGSCWLYDASDGSLLRSIELQPNSCDGANTSLVCYPDMNSIAIAKGTSFEQINFPNLSQIEDGVADR